MDRAQQQAYLERARQGDAAAQGQLLDGFRPYVRVIVHAHVDRRLAGRLDDSDLIQDVPLAAHRNFEQFRGSSVVELAGWLRQIVLGTVANALRRHLGTAQRDLAAERSLEGLAELIADSASTPSAQAMRHEEAARMADALARLPEDMQQVLLGRHLEDLPYAALAERLDRSEGAVRVLYLRALRRLREACQE